MENKLSMYIHRKEILFRENNRISNIGFGSIIFRISILPLSVGDIPIA